MQKLQSKDDRKNKRDVAKKSTFGMEEGIFEYIIIIPSSDKSKKKVGKNNNAKLSSSQCEKLTCEKKVRQNAEVVAEKKKDEVSNTAICLERSMILY